jgi:hypothetical protein
MNRQVRLKIGMGTHALEFTVAQPDTEPAMQSAAAKLDQLLKQANEAAVRQRDGLIQVHAGRYRRRSFAGGWVWGSVTWPKWAGCQHDPREAAGWIRLAGIG